MIEGEELNTTIDPAFPPLETPGVGTGAPVNVPQTGVIRSLGGLLGPDILVAAGAAVNGIAIAVTPGGSTITFAIAGPGTMAQRNAIAAVADLAMVVTNPPTQAEVQAIADKIDELLGAMRTAVHLLL